MYSKFRLISNGEIEIIEDNRKLFLSKLKEGDVFYIQYFKEKAARTLLQNAYLFGGVYPCFVPDNFDSVQDAHKYFGSEYLSRTELVDADNGERLFDIIRQCRNKDGYESKRINRYRDKIIIKVEFRIDWVKSTSVLNKKEFNNYIDFITIKASEMGIRIMSPEDFNAS